MACCWPPLIAPAAFSHVYTVARGTPPMLIALAGYWLVGFLTSLGLGFLTPLAGLGVWIGLAAGLVVVALLLLHRWSARDWLGLLPG